LVLGDPEDTALAIHQPTEKYGRTLGLISRESLRGGSVQVKLSRTWDGHLFNDSIPKTFQSEYGFIIVNWFSQRLQYPEGLC